MRFTYSMNATRREPQSNAPGKRTYWSETSTAPEVDMSREEELMLIYEQKQQAEDELRSRYFTVGSTLPIRMPELVLTPQALGDIEAAEDETRIAYAAFIDACRSA
jgi:hypothetical protein